MGPFKNRKDVWINDLPFSNVDDLGNRWIVTDIDGWWDLPAPEIAAVERSYSEDGDYYEPGRFQSRTIRLTGKIIPSDRMSNAGNIARQELNKRLMLVRKTGLLQVLESPELGGGKQSEVVIVARPLISSDRINGVLEFDIQFRAPDPRKYSTDLSVAEAFIGGEELTGRAYHLTYSRSYVGDQDRRTAIVRNEGDYNTYGVVRLNGPVDSPGALHHEQGKTMRFTDLRLAVGEFIEINLLEKTIISESGVSLRDRLDDSSRWFNFDAGDSRVSILGTAFLTPVPSVPDVKNLVKDPSFEVDVDSPRTRTVRRSYTPNPSGTTLIESIFVRESAFDDHQAEDPASFSGGTVTDGYIHSPSITLVGAADGQFPVYDTNTHHFVQMQLRPTTDAVTTARLALGNRNSGDVALEPGRWETVRVDSYVPGDDYSISLNLPGATSTNRVEVRNIMVLRSPTPIAGFVDFWEPVEGTTDEGLVTTEMAEGGYRQSYEIPEHWTLPENPGSLLRNITEGEESDGIYLFPNSTDPHVISFGRSTRPGTDITFGVIGEGITELRLYNDDTDELLYTSPASHIAVNYISHEEIYPRVEATVSVTAGSEAIPRKIDGVMVTYDGGTKIFTDQTSNEDRMIYDHYSTVTTAREMVESFVTSEFPEEMNPHAREVSIRSFNGSRSLEVVHNIVEDEPVPTPISKPVDPVHEGTYYARARVSSNLNVPFDMTVEGIDDDTIYTFSTSPNFWAEVSFEFEAPQDSTPYLAITPPPNMRDLEFYVDSVGIMTGDEPYFDGDSSGPYQWTGAPHSSVSATIPVVGVPEPKLEIMYRNAWIG